MAYKGKRTFDILTSTTLLLLTLPIQLLVAIAIKATMGSPVLFTQMRPGIGGRPFKMRKFRTMENIDEPRGKVDDASRLTSFGKILRSTSIDELPTIWNIIRGEMSLVGPRPLLMSYLEIYTPFQKRRMEVKPGLTGLAQINGRNSQTWEERFAWDVNYVDNASFRLDLRIIIKTIVIVIRRDGITADGSATMPEFRGSSAATDS